MLTNVIHPEQGCSSCIRGCRMSLTIHSVHINICFCTILMLFVYIFFLFIFQFPCSVCLILTPLPYGSHLCYSPFNHQQVVHPSLGFPSRGFAHNQVFAVCGVLVLWESLVIYSSKTGGLILAESCQLTGLMSRPRNLASAIMEPLLDHQSSAVWRSRIPCH